MNRVTKLIVFERKKKKNQSCINVHLPSVSETLFLEIKVSHFVQQAG